MTTSRTQLSKFTAIFASGTLLSRVLGMVRDMLWARLVPTAPLDCFIVAFRLPNMLRELVGEGAMNAAFVPVFSQALETQTKESFRTLVSAVMSALLLALLLLTFLGVVFAPVLLQGTNALQHITGAQPRSEEDVGMVVSLTRWTFPYLFFIGMAVFAMGPLLTLRHYSTPSWSPALLNIATIACCLPFFKRFPDYPYPLVLGVWLGGIAQVAVLHWTLGKKSGVWWPNFRLGHPGVREVLWLMGPVIIGQAANEVNKLVDMLFAYSLEQGTVKALFYANRMVQLPLSVFAFATAAAVLPAISAAAARVDRDEIRRSLNHGFRQSCFFILPSALGLIVLGKPIIWLLFERGNFVATDTERTAAAMGIYAAGLIPFALVKVAVTGFYGVKDTKTPVIVSSISMFLNIVLCCLLVRPMGFRGLAWATTISFTVNFVVLYICLCDRYGRLWNGEFITALIRMTLASAVVVAAAYALYVRLLAHFPDASLHSRLIAVGAPILLAVPAYLLLCRLLDVKEVRYIMRVLGRGTADE